MHSRPLLLALALLFTGLVLAPVARVDAAPVPLAGITQLDSGPFATCAVFGSGAVTCWGAGYGGELGNGSTANKAVPTTVTGITTATKVAVGTGFACALLADATVRCWGLNDWGSLGNGTTTTSATPVVVSGVANAIDLDAGQEHACAVISGGTVKCWGSNTVGQLGLAVDNNAHSTATTVAGLTSVVQISLGYGHSCARRSDATMRCWGNNAAGQVGIGQYGSSITTPTAPSPALANVIDIATGASHTCAIIAPIAGRQVWCWGNNPDKQLGNVNDANSPQLITTAISAPAHLSAAIYNTCVTTDSLAVYCWGENLAHQLGNNSNVANSAAAVQVAGLASGAVDVTLGERFACALLDTTQVNCWGRGDAGHLGNADDHDSPVPVVVGNPLSEYVGLTPARILDTRPGFTTVDGVGQGGGLVAGGATLAVPVRGRAGISNTTTATALTLTVVNAGGPGYVTVWPCDKAKPTASTVNMADASARANMVIARVATAGPQLGMVCVSPSVSAHLILDVAGYFRSGSSFSALNPARLVDTRSIGLTVDGVDQAEGLLAADTTYFYTVAGRGNVSASAQSAALNVTVTQPEGPGFVKVWPCGGVPAVSNLNFFAGQTLANMVLAGLDASGHVCVRSSVAAHLVIDVIGAFDSATLFHSPAPYRIADSRPDGQTFDNSHEAQGTIAAGTVRTVRVVGRQAPTTSVGQTVVINVVSVGAASPGFLTVYPCGTTRPTASNVNMTVAGGVSSNLAMVKVGDTNSVCVYSSTTTHLVVDFFGWYYS